MPKKNYYLRTEISTLQSSRKIVQCPNIFPNILTFNFVPPVRQKRIKDRGATHKYDVTQKKEAAKIQTNK